MTISPKKYNCALQYVAMQHRAGKVPCQTHIGKKIEYKLVIAYILIQDLAK
jgi:hypothetical protein